MRFFEGRAGDSVCSRVGLCIVSLALLLVCRTSLAQAPTPTPAVKVSAIDDISFGTFTGGDDLTAEDPICVFNNQSSDFGVSFFTGSGSFVVTRSGGSETIPFSVRFKVGVGGYTSMSYNSATNFSGANTSSTICNSSPNATYEIKLTKQNLLSVRPGNYSATLYILLQQPL